MYQMVEELLKLPDIEVDVPDAYGVRPLHVAIRRKYDLLRTSNKRTGS